MMYMMYICMSTGIFWNRDSPGRFHCLRSSRAGVYHNGDYMGSLNKKASGAKCFILALGLFLNIKFLILGIVSSCQGPITSPDDE